MSSPNPETRLHGRLRECERLNHLVAATKAGESQVLVLRGEPGIGKTALLEYVAVRATGCRVVRAGGTESEMELAFAGLHQLCVPMLDRLDQLPEPQREALATAFGLSAGDPPDRFLVGLAVLSLFSDLAERQPVLCLIDDGQWLDRVSAQVLAFVARRLLAERVAMVFAVRDSSGIQALAGLPELVVSGLRERDARALLESAVAGPMDERVRDRIVAETRGNPLALLELPRDLAAEQLAGRFAPPAASPLATRIEQSFLTRLQPLPEPTRRLLLVAAAEPIGDVSLLLHATGQLGIGPGSAAPAEAAGLFELGPRVRFRHPLVRSAIYRTASPEQRRTAHRALAEATDPEADPDRRAWHLAQATLGTDEDVAADLERSAGRAQARGGLAAAAAFLERAVKLTPDPARRARRALAAAQAKLQAGSAQAATALLAGAESGPLDDLERAQCDVLRGQLAFISSHGRDAPPLLVAAARQFQTIEPRLARDTYLDALAAALFVGRFGGDVSVREVAAAVDAATLESAGAPDLLLAGLTETITNGYGAGASGLKRAVAAFRADTIATPEAVRWLWLATHAAHDVWDEDSWRVLSDTHIRLARQAGALHILPLALSARTGLHLFAGELRLASSLVEEIGAVTAATGSQLPPYGALGLAAYRGREAEASALVEAALDDVHSRGEGMGLTLVQHAQAVLYNGLGQYDRAFAAAQQGAAHPSELAFSAWSLVQLVEAAVRTDRHSQAVDAADRLASITRPCGTDWALGIEARSFALVAEGEEAEHLYREALDRLARTALPLELARTRQLYGEWLRREKRRVGARAQLSVAHEMFSQCGAEAFAERARRELHAAGAAAHKRTVATRETLTPQEAQIARLAAAGLTNPEIGTELFLSHHTVEWHLRKVFSKLGVSSRKQLRETPTVGVTAAEPA
jgi:DNA-binding CsgD family transcriptional regulator